MSNETKTDRMERERDEWRAKYIQQNKDLGCEMMDPNGTIWDHAKKLQRERDQLLAAIRNLRDVKGRHHTQIATEQLFAHLSESARAMTPAKDSDHGK